MATFIKGDKIKPLVVLEEDIVEQEVDGMISIVIPKDKYPNLCEYLYISFGAGILTRQLCDQDSGSGMYSVVYHYPYPQEEGEPSDKMLTYSISYTIMDGDEDGYYLCIPAITSTFVTKSNDEQLSSIELSRAATYKGYEVSEDIKNNFKQNIGISGGADWNAQKGEAGYIENRPFGVTHIKDVHFGDNMWELWEHAYIFVACREYNDVSLDDVGYIRFDHDMSHTFTLDGGAGEITVKNSGGFPTIVHQDYFETEEEAEEYLNNVLKIVYIDELDSTFISNTVIKTTPQELSKTDQNQALANLGIDPVVWKYMCKPLVIELEESVPEELIGEFDEVEDRYTLKYPYKNMYVINYSDGYKINPVNAVGAVIEIHGYVGYDVESITCVFGAVYIGSDKKWHVDN